MDSETKINGYVASKRGKHKSGSVKVLIQFRPKTAADGFFYLVGHSAVGRVKY